MLTDVVKYRKWSIVLEVQVSLQIDVALTDKGFCTICTFKGSFIGVRTLVLLEVKFAGKTLGTVAALEWVVASVGHLMVQHHLVSKVACILKLYYY